MTRFFHAGREIDFDQAVELMCDRVRRLKPRNNQDWLDEMPGLVAAIAAGEWSEDARLSREIGQESRARRSSQWTRSTLLSRSMS